MKKTTICLGAGIYNLDTVVQKEGKEENLIVREVGGTCGNIMAILPSMGWTTYPIARLDDSEHGTFIQQDLVRFGANPRFITHTPDGGTTLLKVVHKTDKAGNPKVSVSTSNPKGGRFPNYRFIRMDQAKALLDEMDFIPDVFFFDTASAGHRVLAKALREKGTFVYFEPGNCKEAGFMKSIAVSDVIKFSDQTLPDVSFTEGYKDKLFIQTLGAQGVRFKLGKEDWIQLPPIPTQVEVVDWEGAGDWTTATLLHALSERKLLSLSTLTTAAVKEVLHVAQQTASRSVAYMGSKGLLRKGGSLPK